MPKSARIQRQLIQFDGHTVVIGTTGSGKTVAVKESLARGPKRAVLFFNTQFEDMPNSFVRAGGLDSIRSIKEALKRKNKINFVPSTDLTIQQRQLEFLISSLYDGEKRDIVLVVDEVHLFSEKSVKRQLVRVATTGRRFGIAGVWISQRPAEIPNTLMTQSRKFVIFRTNMESEYFKRYKMPYLQIGQMLEVGGDYSYLTFDWRELKGAFKI